MQKNKKIVSAITKGFLSYLTRYQIEYLLPEIIESLKQNLEESEVAVLITPIKLSPAEEKKAYELVDRMVGEKNLRIKFEVDPEILDGLKLRYKDKLWDMTMAGQIANLRDRMNI